MFEGFICPSHGEEPGRENDIRYCLTRCSKPCASPHVLLAMQRAEQSNYHQGKRISVTMLTGGCSRRTLLERNIPYYLEPKRLLPTYRGALLHLVAENVQDEIQQYGWELELHMELPISSRSGDWLLTGTLDALDRNRNEINDLKTLQDYAIKMMLQGKNANPWSEHISEQYIKQLNIYRYMILKLGIHDKIDKLNLQIVSFKDLIRTGAKQQEVGLQKGYKWTVEPYDVPEVPIVDEQTVEKWIYEEGDEWYQILFEGKKAPVVDEKWAWLCKICQFNGTRFCPNPEAEREGRLEEWLLKNHIST